MDTSQRNAALQAEYLHLQKTVEDFDGKATTIKAWSITFSLAAIVGAYTSHRAEVFMVASAASLLFWTLESIWKSFQLGYYHRIQQIEAAFSAQDSAAAPFQIHASWMERWKKTTWNEVFAMAWWPHIALPHSVIVAGGIVLYALAYLGIAKP